jgi:sulfoxide reductase heme-binding subunit YedZ
VSTTVSAFPVPTLRRLGERPGRFFATRPARVLVWLAGLVPFAYLAWQLWRAWNGEPHTLGREPVKGLEHATGDQAIRFLLFTLAVTPVRQLTGWNWLAKYRRILGLLMFVYATAHLTTFVALDLELDFSDIVREIAKRPYITIGFTAWLLLLPLALTSTAASIRRLGGRTWNRLHWLTYAVAPLGIVHYWWSQKKDHSEPLLWALGFAAVFAWRVWYATRGSARPRARAT